MLTVAKVSLLLISLMSPVGFLRDAMKPACDPAQGPESANDGRMKLPERYREWALLASGFDMTTNTMAQSQPHREFGNGLVNPDAYREFEQTGTWPDKTVIVLEMRGAQENEALNQWGHYQGPVTGIAVHVEDKTLFPRGGWAFFGLGNAKTAKMIAQSASCYSWHAERGAVDTTFVQYYPTLLRTAIEKGTLMAKYLRDLAMPERKETL
jgi:hypothetical protein